MSGVANLPLPQKGPHRHLPADRPQPPPPHPTAPPVHPPNPPITPLTQPPPHHPPHPAPPFTPLQASPAVCPSGVWVAFAMPVENAPPSRSVAVFHPIFLPNMLCLVPCESTASISKLGRTFLLMFVLLGPRVEGVLPLKLCPSFLLSGMSPSFSLWTKGLFPKCAAVSGGNPKREMPGFYFDPGAVTPIRRLEISRVNNLCICLKPISLNPTESRFELSFATAQVAGRGKKRIWQVAVRFHCRPPSVRASGRSTQQVSGPSFRAHRRVIPGSEKRCGGFSN